METVLVNTTEETDYRDSRTGAKKSYSGTTYTTLTYYMHTFVIKVIQKDKMSEMLRTSSWLATVVHSFLLASSSLKRSFFS